MAKVVDVECPKCGVQSRIPQGAIDVDTKEVVGMSCPKCGLDLEFGT